MLKIMGLCLILAATTLMGTLRARCYTDRWRQLRLWQGALQLLETEIIYCAAPLPDALEHLNQQNCGCTALFFRQAGQLLQDNSCCSVEEAWQQAADTVSGHMALRQEDWRIIKELGGSLGRSDQEDQLKHLRLTGQLLVRQTEEAEREAQKNVRLWNYLGFLGGLALVIMLF